MNKTQECTSSEAQMRAALKLAIKALENSPRYDKVILALEACKAALAEQQKPLSDDEIKIMAEQLKQSVFGFPENIIWLARAIERAHGIGE